VLLLVLLVAGALEAVYTTVQLEAGRLFDRASQRYSNVSEEENPGILRRTFEHSRICDQMDQTPRSNFIVRAIMSYRSGVLQ